MIAKELTRIRPAVGIGLRFILPSGAGRRMILIHV
jgi:hypothetical protein